MPLTVLQGKRVDFFYYSVLFAEFMGESCMQSNLTWYPVRSMDGLSTS